MEVMGVETWRSVGESKKSRAEIGASPDTPGSLEGNTEGPVTASSEPLLPS